MISDLALTSRRLARGLTLQETDNRRGECLEVAFGRAEALLLRSVYP
jgi:hypothetical protein